MSSELIGLKVVGVTSQRGSDGNIARLQQEAAAMELLSR